MIDASFSQEGFRQRPFSPESKGVSILVHSHTNVFHALHIFCMFVSIYIL